MALDLGSSIREALDAGWTLPADWYSSPEIARLERERIFAGSWAYVGRAELVAEPGSFFASECGHVPVVVVRDRDGVLRGFVNVCRHRGHLVASGCGRRETIQCPYHAWTYRLDGSLARAPRADREPGLDADELSLLPVSVGEWGPFVFANPDPDAAPLADSLGELPDVLARSGLDLGTLRFRERVEWGLDANWKVSVENYLECYHCPVAHPGFSKVIDVDPDEYALETRPTFSSQFGPVRKSALGGGPDLPYDPTGDVHQAQYHYLFPATTINVDPGPPNLSIDRWYAPSPGRTLGVTEYYSGVDVPEETAAAMVAFGNQVGVEDRDLVMNVQRGLDSGTVTHGRLMPESEKLIAQFQRLVLDSLSVS